ncbi:MAG: carboxylesterase type B [Sphingomonas sp. 28-66-16]|nr:MAG: carboxylesterase type B [Sphingomonas sp. 28-66-16]
MKAIPSTLFKSGALAISLAGAPLLATTPAQRPQAPIVTIDSGRIDGTTADGGVSAYLGIPYAAPPVRDLRWRDPRPVEPWSGIFHADRFGPQCVQPQRGITTNQYSGAEVTSEDCLYLNVWTRPSLKQAPVIVFLHGGGFFIGAGSMPLYAGDGIARQGAVMVNLNYRLGALGFLAHPDLSKESPHHSSGDYGFLDQIAALRWVHRNIARFGGDPDKVTIVGQSAGSMSVLALQASPLARGLFQRAVGMSGAIIGSAGPMTMRSLADAEREGKKFETLMKASDIAGLRAIPADRLVVPRRPDSPAIGPIEDGYVLPDSIESIFAHGKQNDVPLMLGFARDETLGGFGAISGLDDYRAGAAARFGDRAPAFLALYPASSDQEAQMQARLADRDQVMVAAMAAWAEAQVAHGHAPVYSYMFARPHSYTPGVAIPDIDPATAGAYHTSEVPFWLGTLDSFNRFRTTRDWTRADRDFSAAMTESLVAFARTGNPDTARFQWPAFDPRHPRLLELGAQARRGDWPDQRKLAFFQNAPVKGEPSPKTRD